MNILGRRNEKNNVNYIVFLPIDKSIFNCSFFEKIADRHDRGSIFTNFIEKKPICADRLLMTSLS
jgi:hypothetical protein